MIFPQEHWMLGQCYNAQTTFLLQDIHLILIGISIFTHNLQHLNFIPIYIMECWISLSIRKDKEVIIWRSIHAQKYYMYFDFECILKIQTILEMYFR